MNFMMDLQLFGGGGETSSSTSREIPEQTENEKALENFLLDSASLGGNMAPYMYQAFAGSLGNTYTPNLGHLFDQYASQNVYDRNLYTDKINGIMDDYQNTVNGYWDLKNKNQNDYRTVIDGYWNLVDSNLNDYQKATDSYGSQMDNALRAYNKSMDTATSAYSQAAAKRQPLWDSLVNGVLPEQYANNRQAALNADLKGTVGNAINGLASRGVINSSVGNKALDDISQSASDTLAKRYADDLQLEASLLGQDRSNYRESYDVAANTASGKYGSASNTYNNVMNQNANLYQNKGNMYNSAMGLYGDMFKANDSSLDNAMGHFGQMFNSRADNTNSWMQNISDSNESLLNNAGATQQSSFMPATQFLNYAGQFSTPVSNLYNTMYSGRMGTGSTTTTQDNGNGGMWSAIGGLGAAAIVCFTGDTLVTTPDGYKAIKDITVGDTVLSVCDGKVTPKKVKTVITPHESLIVNVYFDNGTVWRTTPHQRYFDGKHFIYFGNRHIPAMVYNGEPSRVLKVEPTDKREIVYDFAVEGFAGENVYFANDVAAEGFGD